MSGIANGHQEAQEAATRVKQVELRVTAPKAKVAMLATMSDDERLGHFIEYEARPQIEIKFLTSPQLYEQFSSWWLSRLPGTKVPTQRKLADRMKAAGMRSVKRNGMMVYGADLVAAA